MYILVNISIAPGTVAKTVVYFVEKPNDSKVRHQLSLTLTSYDNYSPMKRFVILVSEFEILQLAV